MPNNIYLVLSGNSLDESNQILGTDSSLDNIGIEYKDKLHQFFLEENLINDCILFSSQETQAKETISFFNVSNKELDYLNKMNYGIFNGKKTNDFYNSDDYEDYRYNIFNYKFKNGESYRDVKNRILSIMFELNSVNDYDDVIICADKIILQCIYGILNNYEDHQIPKVEINHQFVIKIKQVFSGFDSEKISILGESTCDSLEFF